MNSLNIISHPDDDLLFINPDIIEDMESGHTTTIYLTAGDDGRASYYYQNRKRAIIEAYVSVNPGKYNLMFFGIRSNCFRIGDIYGDLYRMWGDKDYISTVIDLHTKHQPDTFKKDELLELLRNMIRMFKPDIIRTHDPDTKPSIDKDEPDLDHIDHIYTAKFVQEAAKSFPNIPVYGYMGYPIRYQKPNISPELTQKKLAMWRKYQEIDTSVAGEIWDISMNKCYKRRIQ